MPAPVNVKLPNPTIAVRDWPSQAARWEALKREARGNPDFYPLTMKAMYVVGVIHDICTSAHYLLRAPADQLAATYIPAYGVCASGLEILGRCVLGVDDIGNSDRSLRTGFKWLHGSSYHTVPDSHRLVTTNRGSYDIDFLVQLRHFAAHGQAGARRGSLVHDLPGIDFEILAQLKPLIAAGLDRWWNKLQQSEDLCNNLAKANVIAFRDWPVYKMLRLFERDSRGIHHGITEIFSSFDWSVLGH